MHAKLRPIIFLSIRKEGAQMPLSSFSYVSADGFKIAAYRWDPAGEPRAAVQLTHGMGEHAQRYDHVARALNGAGFVVYAQDHRGHGASAEPGALGDLGQGGWPALVDDIGLLTARIRAEHPGVPLILLGHSMGSFAVQQYLLDHSADVDGAVLTGTAVIDLLEPALDLDQPLDLAAFNAPFQPARTDFDWLSRDEAVVDAYVADPRCGFGIDTESAKAMFAGARRLADPAQVAAMRSSLPVHIAVGESDPVNGGLALLTPLVDRYRAAGLADVTVRTYPDARHEILNETNSAEVIAELAGWLDRVLADSGRAS
jgi:alpha-beta hydrolase superfamily lysophospholipase